ncbi:MAG: arsenate reductase [Planctomycetota bacterium]|jgi:arsenate reductase
MTMPSQEASETTGTPRVLFLCTGNACRSQMAEGWLRHLAGDRLVSLSAGTEPHGLNARAVAAMGDAGIDISQQTSDHLNMYLEHPPELVIAVCSNAAESCPTLPGSTNVLSWPFPDPAPGGVDLGASEEETRARFHEVRDAIRERIESWLAGGAMPLDLAAH